MFGNVTFTQIGVHQPVYIEIHLVGMSPGEHGFHVHEKGDLGNGCMNTGGHYNPDNFDHGAQSDTYRHVGDLGNVLANSKGAVDLFFFDHVINLFGDRTIIGRAVVVHNGIDDLGRTDNADSKKTGNAGGRLGCGLIEEF